MELSAEAFEAALVTDAPPPAVAEEPPPSPPVVDDEADVNDAKPATQAEQAARARDDKGKFVKTDEKPVEKKPRNDPQARIDQAIARQREAERRAEDAERRARDLEARQAPAKPADAPKGDEFPDFDEYVAQHKLEEDPRAFAKWLNARDDWRDERRERKQRATQDAERFDRTFSTKAATFSERYQKAVDGDAALPSRINDRLFQVRPYSLLSDADKAQIRAIADPRERDRVAFECFLADHWIDSEHAVALLEHLSDPKNFQRLATLPPNQVIRELATLEAGFSAAERKDVRGPALETKPASKANPPIKPLGATPRVPEDEGSDDEPIEKHIARENNRDRKAGRL